MARKEIDEAGLRAAACFNMTPMIDVCFQLIVVFLCSMKFRTLDQKIEAFLPPQGPNDTRAPAPEETRVDLRLRRRPGEAETRVLLLDTRVGAAEDAGTWTTLRARLEGIRRLDGSVKGRIDADPDVPHDEVITALDTCVAAGITEVAFRGTKTGAIPSPAR